MKTYFRCFVALVLSGQLFMACQQQSQEVKPAAAAGYFVVSATSDGSLPGGRTGQGAAGTTFDLGDLKASREFLFMLANGGEEAIFDVTLTSDQGPFEVSPKRIQSLPGKGNTGIIPLIKVGILHGKQLNGTGLAPALAAGLNQATIQLKGKTIANKDTIEVSGQFTLTVQAKVAGLKVYRDGVEVTYSGRVTWPEQLNFGAPLSGKYTVVNTGNVALRPEVYYNVAVPGQMSPNKIGDVFDLLPGQTREITNLMNPNGDYGTYIVFSDTGAVLVTPMSTRNVDTLEALIYMSKPF